MLQEGPRTGSARPFVGHLLRWRALWTASAAAQPGAVPWPALRAAALRTLCCAVVLVPLLLDLRAPPQPHVDLYPTYVAARLANEGEWSHIYHRSVWLERGVDPEWDQRATALINAPLTDTSFVYHPWYLTALRPLVAQVDYATFQQLSLWINRACVLLVGLGLALLLRWETLTGQLLSTWLVGCTSVTQSSINLGQNGLPALALALGAALCWQRGAPLLLGGALAGLAWACKPWCPTLLLLCFLLRGVRAGVLTTAVLAGIMLVLPELVLPRVLMRDYHALNASLTTVSVWATNNHSILSIIERASSPDWSKHLLDWHPTTAPALHRAAALALSALILAAAASVWWRKRPGSQWTIAAWLAFMIVPLGITWSHYFIFALPLALLAVFSAEAPRAVRALGLALWLLLLVMLRLYAVSDEQAEAYLAQPAGAPWLHALPMLLLAVVLLAALRYGGPRDEPRAASDVRALRREQFTKTFVWTGVAAVLAVRAILWAASGSRENVQIAGPASAVAYNSIRIDRGGQQDTFQHSEPAGQLPEANADGSSESRDEPVSTA